MQQDILFRDVRGRQELAGQFTMHGSGLPGPPGARVFGGGYRVKAGDKVIDHFSQWYE